MKEGGERKLTRRSLTSEIKARSWNLSLESFSNSIFPPNLRFSMYNYHLQTLINRFLNCLPSSYSHTLCL